MSDDDQDHGDNCGGVGCQGRHDYREPGVMNFAARVRRINNRQPCISKAPATVPDESPRRLRMLPHGDREQDYARHDAGGFAVEESEPYRDGDDDWDWEG